MGTLLVAVAAAVGYIIAYHTYGRWLSRKLFRLSDTAAVPSVALNDDRDYVPTSRGIVFGHHFTSIAGTGPIVGPALAVIWGWVPALLWVLFGSIFIGAVHDLAALIVSLRNRGQTVGDIAGRVLNKRVRLLFLFVLLLALTIILAIFGLVIASVFRTFPAAIFPCLVQIPLAIAIGIYLHRKGVDLLLPSIIALTLMYLAVIFGDVGVLGTFNHALAELPTLVWVALLLGYSYVASVLPVWTLLQPRDYINALQLLTALALIMLGLTAAAIFGGPAPADGEAGRSLEIVAPAFRWNPEGAPLLMPFLFITIACGAISGFHCLVSSGTSSKQLRCETDAQFVGYGSMLTEGFLAVLVILACVAGLGLGITGAEGAVLTGAAAYEARYASWSAATGLGPTVAAFVDGAGNFLGALGIPVAIATALMGVLVASFAATTLDTACRLQRYVIQELAMTFSPSMAESSCTGCGAELRLNQLHCTACGTPHPQAPGRLNPLYWLTHKHGATLVAVVTAGAIAAMPAPGNPWAWEHLGTGGLILWPMFGATNQLLAGLAFLVICFWLWRRKLPVWFVVLPMIFMLIMPAWAMTVQLIEWTGSEHVNWPLVVMAVATLALEAWMIVEAVLLWPRTRGELEQALPPLPEPAAAATQGS